MTDYGGRARPGIDIAPDGSLSEAREFVTVPGPDGMAVDDAGNLFVASYDGGVVEVFAPDGAHWGTITPPQGPVTNCTFGGAEGRTLYITTHAGLTVWSLPSPAQPRTHPGGDERRRVDHLDRASPRWAQPGSPTPSPCKGDALPTELSARAFRALHLAQGLADTRVPLHAEQRWSPSCSSALPGAPVPHVGQISTPPPATAQPRSRQAGCSMGAGGRGRAAGADLPDVRAGAPGLGRRARSLLRMRRNTRVGNPGRGGVPGMRSHGTLGRLAQLAERRPYKAKVGGSRPSAPTEKRPVR